MKVLSITTCQQISGAGSGIDQEFLDTLEHTLTREGILTGMGITFAAYTVFGIGWWFF